MAVRGEWIKYGTEQQYLGYIAQQERANRPLPAVIVLQEIWGVDEHIQDVTRRFADAGYVAFAPDLYAKQGVRPEALAKDRVEDVKQFLETLPPTAWNNTEERDAAFAQLPEPKGSQIRQTFQTLFGGLNPANYIEQLLATSAFLRNQHEVSKGGKIGSVGFCMGGALSAVLATRDPNLNAAVIFYGNAPAVEDMKQIACPVYGFYGSLDPRITDAVPDFAKNMKELNKSYQYEIYEGAHHAFFNDTRASYHVHAARDAFAKVLNFYRENLSETI